VKQRFRLTRSTDIQRVRRVGKSYAHPFVVLVAAPEPQALPRIGIIGGSRIGNAVQRNRAKRQIRACLDQTLPHLKPGWDLLILARRPITQGKYSEIQAALNSLFQRAGLLGEESQG
jgi:ribonuclease P protein component